MFRQICLGLLLDAIAEYTSKYAARQRIFPVILYKLYYLFNIFKFPDCSKTTFFYTEARRPQGQLRTLNIDNIKYRTNIPYNWQYGCEVHLNSSWHLGCNGSRLALSQYLIKMKELFGFTFSALWAGGRVVRLFALKVRNSLKNESFKY